MGRRGIVVVVLVLLVLAGAAVVADVVARDRAETRLANEIQDRIAGLENPPDVEIHGVPFLTQLLVGELRDVRVSAPTATVEGLTVEAIDVRLEGVSTQEPSTARQAWMTGAVQLEGLAEALELPVGLAADDEHLVTTVQFLGLPVDILVVPHAAGRALEIEVRAVRVGGAMVDLTAVPGVSDRLDGITVPIDALPEGLELTDVSVVPGAVEVEAEGTDVLLATPEE